MEICAIICEFNPFHNGHAYIISEAKKLTGCDAVVCVMSGSFTQRGEICRTDKFLRAKHAVLCGADAVLELPASFAVAPAEIFARGAVKILSAVNAPLTLSFGCENGNAENFARAAEILCNESETFKRALTDKLNGGESYIRAYSAAFNACGGKDGFISSPNNILGVEYAKAVLKSEQDIRLSPVKRKGAGYGDTEITDGFASARGIRANANIPAVKRCMPGCAYEDFINSSENETRFNRLAADWLFMCDKDNLKRVYGCTEGLENRLKSLAEGRTLNEIADLASTKRYPKSRIMRILTANLLQLYADETETFLRTPLPPKILAVKKESADRVLPYLSADAPTDAAAEKCGILTSRSYALWRHLSAPLIYENPNEKMILI